MTSKSMSFVADDYFYNLNSLAKRIGEDVNSTKEAYEGLWNSLSLKEKNQAIDETIIQPQIALKYTLTGLDETKKLPDFYPKLRIQTGMKYVIDETGRTLKWKDEHSGPFSFMTKSQMNLHSPEYDDDTTNTQITGNYNETSPHFISPIKITENCSFESSLNEYSPTSTQVSFYQSESFTDSVYSNVDSHRLTSGTSGTTTDNTENIFTKFITKTALMKLSNSPDDDMKCLVSQNNVVIRNGHKNGINNGNSSSNQMNMLNLTSPIPKSSEINERTALLYTPSSYSNFQFSKNSQDDAIPKTGFEFLDNW